jgi:hypothetical protein
MIEYVSNFYEKEKRPVICKKFVAENGEESHTVINVGNETELSSISAEIIYSHMDNVLRYLDAKIDDMTLVQLNELGHQEPWPIKGWSEVEWCQNEIVMWWNYIYYKDFDARVQAYLTAEYDAAVAHFLEDHEVQDHTHDPETGEEIPNPPAEETPA